MSAGERDAATLAKLRNRRIKADEIEVAAALQGNWRDEHLFALKQALTLIDAGGRIGDAQTQHIGQEFGAL